MRYLNAYNVGAISSLKVNTIKPFKNGPYNCIE